MADFYHTELAARIFDLQNADDPLLEEECAFFLDVLAEADGPCLDLGCGTGRILIPALEQSSDVYGCDLSAAFLKRAEQKALLAGLDIKDRLWLCDLASPAEAPVSRGMSFGCVSLDGLSDVIAPAKDGFALALAAFRTFDHLAGQDERESFLLSLRHLLRPSGRLLLNLANPTAEDLESAMGEKVLLRDDLEDAETGCGMVWWGATHFEPGSNLIQQAYVFDFLAPDGRVTESYHFPLTMRWTPGEEMKELADRAGFRVKNRWGGFKREPYERGTGDSVWELEVPQ